ncbi:MAG: nickel pincer cofactor biosynthesis protein LarC [Deltaproteobacteria bacterium]|nr:nickel pincer cofactor biosynthesis protein LarC [Deltaproteobacteria bacterium]
MMRILYLDCPTGVSGDMFLASLIDFGVDYKAILKELRKLPVDKIEVDIRKEVRHSITGTTFRVKMHESHHHRTFRDIKKIITGSRLSKEVKDLSVAIFKLIAEAEGKVHGIPSDKVHFHEVGAMDSIIDIVGAALAVTSLKVDKVVCSPVPLGSGIADTMHGRIPIPAPATVEILKGATLAASDIPFELTTPTGAAIVKTLASSFGPMPAMVIEATGYGAGKKDFRESANMLRAFLGTSAEGSAKKSEEAERLIVLETNIDDMSPQIAGYLLDKLLKSGALDCFFTPVVMKKTRPGILLTVLTDESLKHALLDIIFRESTSIGVRSYPVERHCLPRKTVNVKTRYGTMRAKVSYKNGEAVNAQPEYEDAKALAEKKGAPLKEVLDAARAALSGKKG